MDYVFRITRPASETHVVVEPKLQTFAERVNDVVNKYTVLEYDVQVSHAVMTDKHGYTTGYSATIIATLPRDILRKSDTSIRVEP